MSTLANSTQNLSEVIVRPRITEKAASISGKNIYTFEVAKSADKKQIKKALKEIYNVTVTSVHMLPIPSKQVVSRGKIGTKKGGKKAYVELKDGDKIEFV